MTTDVEWTWTIIMRNGQSYHLADSCDIMELLQRFQNDGYHLAEIEAIIRH